MEAMQFGRALERLLFRIRQANPRYGPVYMAKVDLADGFSACGLPPGISPIWGPFFRLTTTRNR
jgi:hypothetical protein